MLYRAVKGMNDIYGKEAFRWGRLEQDIRHIISRFDYNEIKTPVIEEYGLFARGLGSTSDVVQKEMYTLEDRNNQMLALRPEGTAGVVRAYIEHNLGNEFPLPQKYFYIGPNYRYERPQKGRYRQFYQLGLEIFGDPSPEMDAELIYTAHRMMEHFKVKVDIQINSVGCPNCRPLYREKLINYLRPLSDTLCDDCNKRLDINPLRVLDCKKDNVKERFPDLPLILDNLCEECSDHFSKLKNALDIFHVPYIINPFIVRGLDYYTKTAFEITADTGGSQNAIAAGGRYDNLVGEMGGTPTPATGFAVGIERLLLAIPESLYIPESIIFCCSLFDGGIPDLVHFVKHISHHPVRMTADYQPRKLKAALKKADKLGARHAVIFGEDEVARKCFLYKDMQTGAQQVLGQHEIIPFVNMVLEKELG